jgi:type IX secretion system PorP/SprF family membrane protein
MKKIQFLFIYLLLTAYSFAQQDPQFSQYMYNMSVINPGYATDNLGVYNFGSIFRSQWVGAVGAPTTITAFMHTPISDKLETGLNVVRDELGEGVLSETNLSGDLAYVAQISKTAKLSFGIKVGLNLLNTNFNGFQLNDDDIGPDSAFQNLNQAFFNLGAGAFYFSDNYYIGVSVPNFLPNKYLKEDSGINTIGVDELHFFITGGYVFQLSENVKFKPSFMSKIVKNAPLSLDINGNFLFFDKFEIGASYRIDDSVLGMTNYKILPSLRVGYAYDYTLSNLGNFNSGTHEIMILFDLESLNKKGFDKSPRFF